MKITVANDIKDILFERNAVIVPGFGALTSEYKSANVDGVTGKMTPPALDIQFNSNQTTDDGILVDFLKSKYGATTAEVQEAISHFNKTAYDAFEKHEILPVPEVGRFYKDFTEGIRFLPEKTNFNIDSFGLPTLQYYPVSRTRVEMENAIEKMAEKPMAKITSAPMEMPKNEPLPQSIDTVGSPSILQEEEADDSNRFLWRSLIPFAAVGMVAFLVVFIYKFSQNTENTEGPAIDKMNVNTKPPKERQAQITPPPPVAPVPAPTQQQKTEPAIANENMVNDNTKPNESAVTNVIVTPPEGEKSVIIIGGFANKSNIKKLKDYIAKNNFGLYERKSGGMTVIGAEVIYKDKKELRALLNRFKARYGDEVEIME
jgi:cell division septation protein DedD